MNNFNKKQKTIIIIIISVIIVGIYYYVNTNDKNFLIEQDSSLDLETNEEKSKEEKDQEELESENNTIIVHISGAVFQEGIVELTCGSRISNAIEKAGGLKENACIEDINLAYILEDGIKIHIPTKEEVEKNNLEKQQNKQQTNQNEYITKSSRTNSESETNIEDNTTSKININTATQTQLETLPGIGKSTALKIINYRKEKGNFKSIEDIKQVGGIAENKFNKIKDLIEV